MTNTDPYAKLGGGALDQELFKKKTTPPPHANDTAKTHPRRLKAPGIPAPRQGSISKESTPISPDVVTSSLQDVNLRDWKDMIENTETHNSSLRLTTKEGDDVEDVITDLKRQWKVKTSLNEIARLGLLYLLHDFKKYRENSLIYKVKKS